MRRTALLGTIALLIGATRSGGYGWTTLKYLVPEAYLLKRPSCLRRYLSSVLSERGRPRWIRPPCIRLGTSCAPTMAMETEELEGTLFVYEKGESLCGPRRFDSPLRSEAPPCPFSAQFVKRVAFRSGDFRKHVILVGGLGDGLLPVPYTTHLARRLNANGWSLVQVSTLSGRQPTSRAEETTLVRVFSSSTASGMLDHLLSLRV
jgi:hypothetical protein